MTKLNTNKFGISWYVHQHAIYMTLSPAMSVENFRVADRRVTEMLQSVPMQAALIIDASDMEARLLDWTSVRMTQTYGDHPNLQAIFVILPESNRVVRLMMLIMFNLARAPLHMVSSLREVDSWLQRYGIPVS